MAEANELEGKKLVLKYDGQDKTYYEADMSEGEKSLFNLLQESEARLNLAKKNVMECEILKSFYTAELKKSLEKDEQEREKGESYGGTN